MRLFSIVIGMDNRLGLLLSVWGLVSLMILWLLPKDTYMQGSIAGILLGIAGAIVCVHGYFLYLDRKNQP
jgi:hypothetical protein